MLEARIKELELQLAAANATIATLTTANEELTQELATAEARNKKLNRSAWNTERAVREPLTVAPGGDA